MQLQLRKIDDKGYASIFSRDGSVPAARLEFNNIRPDDGPRKRKDGYKDTY
jgi:hypothetical protein